MGQKITIKQNNFSHGMQSETRNKNLVGQTQVFGAERIKHFDIYSDANKLSPVPSFERFNTDAEKALGIVALGGKSGSTVYGLGKGLDNWYGTKWDYRILLTPASTGSVDYMFIDLSNLSTNFWDNVNADGSDIRVTSSATVTLQLDTIIKSFDKTLKKGFVLIKTGSLDNVYLYFGNTTATAITTTYEGFASGSSYFYSLDNSITDFTGIKDLDQGTPVYSPARISDGLSGGNPFSLTGASTGSSGVSISFHVSTGATGSFKVGVADDTVIYGTVGSNIRIDVDRTTSSIVALDTGFTVVADTDYYISWEYEYGTGYFLYVNGVQEYSDTGINYTLTNDSGQNRVETSGGAVVELVNVNRNGYKTSANAIAEGLMFSNATFYTEGTLELYSAITPTYSGVGLYSKDINGTAWEEVNYNGVAVKDVTGTLNPMPAFLEKNAGKYFFSLNSSADYTGLYYGAEVSSDTIDTTIISQRNNDDPITNLIFAKDKEYYIFSNNKIDVYDIYGKSYTYFDDNDISHTVTYTSGYNVNVYNAFPIVNSTVTYGNNIALTGTLLGRASLEIWDLLNLDPQNVIELGTGNSRVIANVGGSLVAVVDNYIQDKGLSNGNPSLDFRTWIGQDGVKTLQSFKFDNDTTTFTHDFQKTIDNRRVDIRNGSVFQAEPKTDWKGMWAIGQGEKNNQFGISILYDTETIGRALQYHSIGENFMFVTETGEIYKINGDNLYTQTSTFDSMIIDAGVKGRKKKIKGIEIVLDKDLPVGQTITLKYSTDSSAFSTIGTLDTGESSTEFTLANGEAFDNFNELQLRIESTGGDTSVVEYSIVVEYEQELI